MSKLEWKPGTMVYPVPAVMVSCGDMEKANIITVAWTGTICTDPAMTYISIRPERYSYEIIKNTKEFVINLTTKELAYATDFAGVKSGAEIDKFETLGLTKEKANKVSCPLIKESPLNIECEVVEIKELGSHHMFIAKVLCVDADEKYMDEKNRFCLEKCNLMAYSHGQYYELGDNLGKFGFSVKKK
ncbi:MAG: flavin reductase family protein [Clostridia bacterium]|nr:flavin reductase family protein [Clostridia bacterium]